MVAVIGLIAMIFDSKTINIFANSFIKNPNPFIKNQLSIIQMVKNLLPKYVTDSLPQVFGYNAYKLQPSLSERVIVDGHGCHTALDFGVKAKENQDKVPTLYWYLNTIKKTYKARFITNSSSCTTTEFSKLLTSCLTAVKNMLSSIVKRYMSSPVKTYFGLLK